MSYRYKIGEAVLVRDDLEYGAFYDMRSGPYLKDNSNIVTLDMSELRGQLVHIKDYSSGGQYLVEETNDFRWTDDMFSGPLGDVCHCKSLL